MVKILRYLQFGPIRTQSSKSPPENKQKYQNTNEKCQHHQSQVYDAD